MSPIRPNPPKSLEDDLWYPILVPMNGYCNIVEMQGKEVNLWNQRIEGRLQPYDPVLAKSITETAQAQLLICHPMYETE